MDAAASGPKQMLHTSAAFIHAQASVNHDEGERKHMSRFYTDLYYQYQPVISASKTTKAFYNSNVNNWFIIRSCQAEHDNSYIDDRSQI